MQQARNASGASLLEAMVIVIVIFIIAMAAVPVSTSLRNRASVAAALETAKTIRAALGYYAAGKNDTYPETQDARPWDAFRSLCAVHGAGLAETPVRQGLCFFQYRGLDVRGGNCDNSDPDTACRGYRIIMRARHVDGDVAGAQLTITESGILRQTY